MLPNESGNGQLWRNNCYLCDVLYEIKYPLAFTNVFSVKQARLIVQNYEPASLLVFADLTLVAEDGGRYPLPQSLRLTEDGQLEYTVNSKEE